MSLIIEQNLNTQEKKIIEPYTVLIDNVQQKVLNLIAKESGNKLKATYKFIEACFEFLKVLEDKLKEEKTLLERFSIFKINEEKGNIIKLLTKTKSN